MIPEQEKYFKAWWKTQMDIGAAEQYCRVDAERAWEAAILTERERCAKIAKGVADYEIDDYGAAIAVKIVKAIRGE